MTPERTILSEGKPTRTADAKRRGAEAARQLLVGCRAFAAYGHHASNCVVSPCLKGKANG